MNFTEYALYGFALLGAATFVVLAYKTVNKKDPHEHNWVEIGKHPVTYSVRREYGAKTLVRKIPGIGILRTCNCGARKATAHYPDFTSQLNPSWFAHQIVTAAMKASKGADQAALEPAATTAQEEAKP